MIQNKYLDLLQSYFQKIVEIVYHDTIFVRNVKYF